MEETSLFQKLKIIYVGGLSSEDKPDSPSLVHKLYSVMLPWVVAEGVTCSIEKPQAVQADIFNESQSGGRHQRISAQEHSTLLDSSPLNHQ